MSNRNFVLGKFWHPDRAMDAIKELFEAGVDIYDVYSPFPLHGLEPYLNIKRTRLTVAAFIYGAFGLALALTMMNLIFGVVWPMNVGGKPNMPIPAEIPISFETTVLFAAHGMIITFFIVGRYWPGKKAILFDDRQTDDIFVVALEESKLSNPAEVKEVLRKHGAYDVTEKEA